MATNFVTGFASITMRPSSLDTVAEQSSSMLQEISTATPPLRLSLQIARSFGVSAPCQDVANPYTGCTPARVHGTYCFLVLSESE